MVGLIGVGITSAVTVLKDRTDYVFSVAAGEKYEVSGGTVRYVSLLSNGTKVTGKYEEWYGAIRSGRLTGTRTGNVLEVDFLDFDRCPGLHWQLTTTDQDKTFSGVWSGGGCGTGTFTLSRIGG